MSEPTPTGAAQAGGGEPPPAGRLRTDFIVAAVLLVFCVVVYWLTTTFEEVPSSLSLNMPPEFFPRLLVWTIAGLTVAMLLEGRRRPEKQRRPIPPMVYYTALALVVFLVLTELFGLTLTMVAFCAALPLLWGERRLGILAVYAVAFPAGVYLLFVHVLEVRFPTGLVFRAMGYFINL